MAFAISGAALWVDVASPATARVAVEPRPNILIVLTDDQRATGTFEVMPELRSWLRRGGVSFTRAHATTPLCCPSRATLATGLYAHNHGATTEGLESILNADAASVVPAFRGAGYRTGMFGKYLNGWPLDRRPSGIDTWAVLPRVTYERPATWNVGGTATEVTGYSTDYIRHRAIRFLDEAEDHDDDPWLLYLAPIAPHMPAVPAARDEDAPVPTFRTNPAMAEADRTDKPTYVQAIPPVSLNNTQGRRRTQLRSLMAVDRMLGSLRSTLADLHEGRRTIVIFTSDNGFTWGEHGIGRSLGGKTTPYLPSIRVPLMIRWPGHVLAASKRNDLVGLVDLPATIMAAASIDPPHALDGHDLFSSPPRSLLLLEYWHLPNHPTPTWAGFITPNFEYVEYRDEAGVLIEREAYALSNDPWQLENLFRDGDPTNDPSAAQTSDLLRTIVSCAAASCP